MLLNAVKIGLLGLGTVGGGVANVLSGNRKEITRRAGREIVVTHAATREPPTADVDTDGMTVLKDAWAIVENPDIDVVVELIGGYEPARELTLKAIENGKHVVTANKALIALHGNEIFAAAQKKGVTVAFEAAVAGGIPIIKAIREGLAGNHIDWVAGIINGTGNFILTEMRDKGRDFADVLAEAQALGYAEADPTFDIGGFDAAHKLALLTSLAFGTRVAFEQIHVEGIQSITQADIEASDSLGYRIKLLGVAVETETGIEARVSPALVYKDSAIAEVSGVTNAVAIDGDFSGNILLVGPGAGAKPTASAVAGDILDIARGLIVPPFVTPTAKLKAHKRAKLDQHYGSYYVRLALYDKPGAMANVAKSMGDQQISLESIVQHRPQTLHAPRIGGRAPTNKDQPVIIITHEATEQSVRKALETIEKDGIVTERPQMIRIEEL